MQQSSARRLRPADTSFIWLTPFDPHANRCQQSCPRTGLLLWRHLPFKMAGLFGTRWFAIWPSHGQVHIWSDPNPDSVTREGLVGANGPGPIAPFIMAGLYGSGTILRHCKRRHGEGGDEGSGKRRAECDVFHVTILEAKSVEARIEWRLSGWFRLCRCPNARCNSGVGRLALDRGRSLFGWHRATR